MEDEGGHLRVLLATNGVDAGVDVVTALLLPLLLLLLAVTGSS